MRNQDNIQKLIACVDAQRSHKHTLIHNYTHGHTCFNCRGDFSSWFKQTVFLNAVGEPSERESPISHQTSHCVAENTFKEPLVAARSHPHTHINTYNLKQAHKGSKILEDHYGSEKKQLPVVSFTVHVLLY